MSRYVGETYSEVGLHIHEMAVKAFKDHKVIVEGPGEWYCGAPGTGMYSFRILCRPGMVAFWGDLGEFLLRHGDKDSFGWVQGSIRSRDYFMEKVRAGKARQFYPANAMKHLDEMIAEHDKDAEEARKNGEKVHPCIYREIKQWLSDNVYGDEMSEDNWHEAWSECGGDDCPRCEGPTPTAFWMLESFAWFTAHV